MRTMLSGCLLVLALAGGLFFLAKAVPAEALAAYRDHLAASPQSSIGCGCPGCSCVSCSCG